MSKLIFLTVFAIFLDFGKAGPDNVVDKALLSFIDNTLGTPFQVQTYVLGFKKDMGPYAAVQFKLKFTDGTSKFNIFQRNGTASGDDEQINFHSNVQLELNYRYSFESQLTTSPLSSGKAKITWKLFLQGTLKINDCKATLQTISDKDIRTDKFEIFANSNIISDTATVHAGAGNKFENYLRQTLAKYLGKTFANIPVC